jgi:prepilin-type N-terminal cleavage/methylation domain-containing protein
MKKTKIQHGFTIAELMIATTIFSVVLIVILAAFMQIGRMFYKGVSLNSTTEAARNLVDNISNDAKLSYAPGTISPPSAAGVRFFCVGSHRYSFVLNKQVKSTDVAEPRSVSLSSTSGGQGGIIQDVINICSAPAVSNPGTQWQQLLGPDMQLNALDITPNTNGVAIHAHVIFYGFDNTVFTPSLTDANAQCSGNLLSTQFCAVADINTLTTTQY